MQHHSDSERSQTLRALDELIARSNDPTPAECAAGILGHLQALECQIADIVTDAALTAVEQHQCLDAAVDSFGRAAHEHMPNWVSLLAFEQSMAAIRRQFPSEAADETEKGRQSSLSKLILSLMERTA